MTTHAHYVGSVEEYENLILTLVLPPVQCGAPGPPESYQEKRIQLSDLVDHPYASYLWIASGDSMIGAGIHSGDFLLVDKALHPHPQRYRHRRPQWGANRQAAQYPGQESSPPSRKPGIQTHPD